MSWRDGVGSPKGWLCLRLTNYFLLLVCWDERLRSAFGRWELSVRNNLVCLRPITGTFSCAADHQSRAVNPDVMAVRSPEGTALDRWGCQTRTHQRILAVPQAANSQRHRQCDQR